MASLSQSWCCFVVYGNLWGVGNKLGCGGGETPPPFRWRSAWWVHRSVMFVGFWLFFGAERSMFAPSNLLKVFQVAQSPIVCASWWPRILFLLRQTFYIQQLRGVYAYLLSLGRKFQGWSRFAPSNLVKVFQVSITTRMCYLMTSDIVFDASDLLHLAVEGVYAYHLRWEGRWSRSCEEM